MNELIDSPLDDDVILVNELIDSPLDDDLILVPMASGSGRGFAG